MKARIPPAVLTICVLFVIAGESRACYTFPPPPPTLSSPADGSCTGSTTVTLAWNSAYGATSYYVYYGQSSFPTSPGTPAGCCSLQVSLSSNAKYYWRVRACNSYGFSDYSSQRCFYTTTQPAQATNPSPGSPSSGISLDAVLSWTAGSGATSHDVYFGTNSSPGAPEFKGNQPNTTYDPPGALSSGTTYYWRIDEKNDCTTQGTTWYFTTCSVPGQATIPNPASPSSGISINADLSWTEGSGATSHDVYFGTSFSDVNNGTGGTFKGNQPGTTYELGTLSSGTTYYWRINEKNTCDTTTGTTWQFTTCLMAGEPSDSYPAPNATVVPLDVNLCWTPGEGAVSHDVYFGTDFNDVNNANTSSAIFKGNQDTNSYDPNLLESATGYFWRIDEVNSCCTRKGAVWQFTTCGLPGQASEPNVRGPTGEPNTIDSILSWTPGSLAELHDVYFGTDPNNLKFMCDTNEPNYDTRRVFAFLFTSGSMSNIGSLGRAYEEGTNTITWAQPFGINESGKIVGLSYDPNGKAHAFINVPSQGYDPSWTSPLTDLHPLGDSNESAAYDISDSNWIVGSISSKAFVLKYPDDMNMTKLPSLFSETDHDSVARAVSNGTGESGPVAVGWSGGKAVLWDGLDSNDPNIYTVGPSSFYYRSKAFGVNRYRQAAGYYCPIFGSNPRERAFVGDLETGLTDVGTLQQGSISRAYGINDSGQVVGEATIDANDEQLNAFIYDNGQICNLNDLVQADTNDPNWLVLSARSINNDGFIVGYGKASDSNEPNNYNRSLLLVPVRPVGHWQFDEGSGSVAMDSSLLGNHGTIHGASWTSGKIRGALDFDGDGDYVEIPDDDSLTPSSQITICWWVFNRGGQAAGIYKYACCPGEDASPGNSRAYGFSLSETGVSIQIFSAVNTYDDLTSSNPVSLYEWHHAAGTFNRGQAALYLDGHLEISGTLSVSSIMNDVQPLIIGGCWGYCGADSFLTRLNGLVDDVRIYPFALNQAEITELFEDRGLQ